MKKSLNLIWQKLPALLYTSLCIALLLFASACGEADYSSSEIGETGSISFSIEWRGAPTIQSTEATHRDIDCDATGVETVTFEIYDENDSYLTGDSWDCLAHFGTVNNVPSGSNRKLVVLGKDSSLNVLYWGEKTGISISAGQETNVGSIVVDPVNTAPTTPTNVSAAAGDGQVLISWDSVTITTGYLIYWSTTTGVSKTFKEGKISSITTTSYTHAGRTNGTTYYYVVTAVNSYDESDESSEVSATPSAIDSKLPDTGQTLSYTSTFGEDSDYTINPPSYTDNGDGTITDNVTSLIWQKEDDNRNRIWDDANSYCNDLTLASYSDWRLPSKKDLMSIVDYGTAFPSIDRNYFPDTFGSYYWSTTRANGSYAMYAWCVDFGIGRVNNTYKSMLYDVRCVRSQELSFGNFNDNGNGTVTDINTELIWQQGEDEQKTWEDAISYCEDLSLTGHTDWRLPNIKELESITDDSVTNPAINTYFFPDANASSYWSSTTDAFSSSSTWCINFSLGSVSSASKSYYYYVRCVRGGQ